MRPDPLILAFDTSAAHCAAALLSGDDILAHRSEEMSRGQAERLFPLLEEVCKEAGVGWQDLNALGVGIGPGNFTGIRISVSAARGLSLSLGIPAIGVSTFAVLRDTQPSPHPGLQLVSVSAPRGQVYLQAFQGAEAYGRPLQTSIEGVTKLALLPDYPDLVIGQNAEVIATLLNTASANSASIKGIDATPDDPAQTIAKIAKARMAQPGFVAEKPAPLYVRAPDAAPPRDPAPVILPDPI